MQLIENALKQGKTNFILIGEAGCGKSEISLNLAKYLEQNTDKEVHIFDMDMTKPLFRSRDLLDSDELDNINFHFEEQFYDAPTLVGGVREYLADENSIVVMDVGGDDIGARSIGGFMMNVKKESLCVLYVLNYYRPFCRDIDHIDKFLAEILSVSRLSLEDVHFVDNPNAGITTSIEETVEGAESMENIISEYREIEMICVREDLFDEVSQKTFISDKKDKLMPIHLYLTYEWLKK